MENIIEVNEVSIKFNLYKERIDNLKEYIIKLVKGNLRYEEFYALQNISFSLKPGDSLGLIGRNGSGKSTLLKLLAGVLKPTKGNVVVRGTIAPLIELGAGFDIELTARENIFLNGAVLGFTKNFIKSRFQDIVEFSELEEFLDVPMKNFSSGMFARLGFAIATSSEPDVLIVDEVLAVGDSKFQKKCETRIQSMLQNGTTLLFVSHNSDQVSKLCKNALWLDHGYTKMYGNSEHVCGAYEQ